MKPTSERIYGRPRTDWVEPFGKITKESMIEVLKDGVADILPFPVFKNEGSQATVDRDTDGQAEDHEDLRNAPPEHGLPITVKGRNIFHEVGKYIEPYQRALFYPYNRGVKFKTKAGSVAGRLGKVVMRIPYRNNLKPKGEFHDMVIVSDHQAKSRRAKELIRKNLVL
ncbi:hypothetical protein HDU97_000908 [Phlyctochytrium planicorne]|nr:hypothetical protein HDU97_000908 [Phlyctochytrium planicorne]